MVPSGPPVVLRDPVHGDIELSKEEITLVDTPEFQRLRGIKQLGSAYLVYPGAMHTRFEHSIGTMHMTGRLLDAVDRNAARDPAGCLQVTPMERRILRIAALLHDVTHIPFGHNIEDQTGLLPRHDRPERFQAMLGETGIGAVLRRLGIHQEVLSILTGEGRSVPAFWRQVVSDTIDSDLMDYLRRDAWYTGLELRYDDRIVQYFRVDRASGRMFVDCEKHGMLREDIVSEILRMLEIRYHFSERVYYHHAKIAAGASLSRMVELALKAGALSVDGLMQMTDQTLLDRLGAVDLGEAGAQRRMQRLVANFASRRLLKRVLVLPWYLNRDLQGELIAKYFTDGQPEPRFAFEAAVEATAKRELGVDLDVVLYCPRRRMQLKEVRTLVRFPGQGDRILPLSELRAEIPRVADLEEGYLRLWKLYVFTSATDLEVRRRLQQICLDLLPAGCTNAFRLG